MHPDRFRRASEALTALFFLLLLFAFAPPREALLSLLAVLLHEGAHLLAERLLCKKKSGSPALVTAGNGFRLRARRFLSYREELLILAAGPAANLLCFFLFFCCFGGDSLFAAVSLLTALTNLCPVSGCDGYRIAELLCLRAGKSGAWLSSLSLGISLLFSFVALYLILRVSGGYFAFFSFLFGFFREAKLLPGGAENRVSPFRRDATVFSKKYKKNS